MNDKLRALVIGAGQAGQGHAMALRFAGAEVVGLCSRAAAAGRRVAEGLRIPKYSTDWRGLLADLKPDIVAVATPGGTHVEMIGGALEAGCHVFAEKPLATTARDAKQLYEQSRAAGVKTGYAASFWYQPQALMSREIVRSGQIGRVFEAECVSHFAWPALVPFGWPHRLEEGGGRLNNGFPHTLAIVQSVLGGEILAAMGEARFDLKRVPRLDRGVHINESAKRPLTAKEAAKLDWAEVDSDWSYTALLRIGDPAADVSEAVSVTFRHSALRRGWPDDFVAFYGEKGTLHVRSAYMQGNVYLRTSGLTWEQQGLPVELRDWLPDEEDHNLRNWMCLARDFVKDILGQPAGRYLTFRDGWIYQEVIDMIRSNSCWKPVTQE